MGGLVNEVADTINDAVDSISSVVKNVWKVLGDDVLGIDDEKFFGIKSKQTSQLGSLLKDSFYDSTKNNTYNGILAIAISFGFTYVASAGEAIIKLDRKINRKINNIVNKPLIPTNINNEYFDFVKFNFGLYSKNDNTNSNLAQLQQEIMMLQMWYQQNEQHYKRVSSGAIYDWLPGGELYNALGAGGELYDSTSIFSVYDYLFMTYESQVDAQQKQFDDYITTGTYIEFL